MKIIKVMIKIFAIIATFLSVMALIGLAMYGFLFYLSSITTPVVL